MNILYDLRHAQNVSIIKYHGGAIYTEFLLQHLYKLEDINLYVLYSSKKSTSILDDYPDDLFFKVDYDKLKSLKDFCEKNKISKIFFPAPRYVTFYNDFFESNVVQILLVLHDIREVEIENDYYYWMNRYKLDRLIEKSSLKLKIKFIINRILWGKNYYTKYLKTTNSIGLNEYGVKLNFALKFSNVQIITDSEYSKYSIIRKFKFIAKTPLVFSPPILLDQKKAPLGIEISKKYSNDYFLILSAARAEKGTILFIEAFNELAIDKKLIVVSHTKINVKYSNVIFITEVNRSELISLYSNAFAFVYPSFYEGYGLPPTEAMGFGIPVLASGSTSIFEVLENNALYFRPGLKYEIQTRIIQILDEATHEKFCYLSKLRHKELLKIRSNDLNRIIEFIITS